MFTTRGAKDWGGRRETKPLTVPWQFVKAGAQTIQELAQMGPRKALRRLRIRWLRYRYGPVQLWTEEIESIVEAITCWPGCRLLVFGTGYDTPLWHVLNRQGRTAFIEDDPYWIETATRSCPGVEVHRVTYPTVLSQWPMLLHDPERTFIELPAAVTAEPSGTSSWWTPRLGRSVPSGRPMGVRPPGGRAPSPPRGG